MTRFPTPGHLVSWAKFAPGVKESAGKKKGKGSTGHGNSYLARILGEAAVGAARTGTFLGERYRRIARRRGKKKAFVAVGRSILVIISLGTCCPAPAPATPTSAAATSISASTPTAASKPTSATSKPSATKSPSNPPPDQPHHPTIRLRCVPPDTAACPARDQFSD